MAISDGIQIGILLALLATLIIVGRQSAIQNRLLKAELLRNRFEMYWRTYEPVTADQVKEFKVLTEDYMHPMMYTKKYEGHEEKIHRYIAMTQFYEYLAFTHGLEVLGLPDPLGYEWTRRWTRDLLDDETFRDVHNYHGSYYPKFASFVAEQLLQGGSTAGA